VTPVAPANGAVVRTAMFLAWSESTDPDTDALTYSVEIAEDAGFSTGLLVKDDILIPIAQISLADGLLDGQTYYWRVSAVDEFGLSSGPSAAFTFNTDNTNETFDAAIHGVVVDKLASGNPPIEDVTIETLGLSPNDSDDSSASGFFNLIQVRLTSQTQEVTIRISKSGFITQEMTVTATAGDDIADAGTIELIPTGGQFVWGDLSADGQAGTYDGSLILQWLLSMITTFPVDPSYVKPDFPPGGDVNDDAALGGLDGSEILQLKVDAISQFTADTDGNGVGPEGLKAFRRSSKGDPGPTTRILSVPELIELDPGDEVLVPVDIDDATGVLSLLIDLRFHGLVLEYLGFEKGGLLNNWGTVGDNLLGDTVRVVGFGAQPLNGSGTLVRLRFRVRETASGLISQLDLTQAQLNDGAIPTVMANGTLLVSGESLADVDRDGDIDAVDIQFVINAALDIPLPEGYNADLTGDDVTNAQDVQLVILGALGLTKEAR
jgi:cohesin domain-containing protein/dockerin type I repeat protein